MSIEGTATWLASTDPFLPQASEVWLYTWSPLVHLAVGLMVGAILLLCIVIKEDFILAFLVTKFKGGESAEEEEEVVLPEMDKPKVD